MSVATATELKPLVKTLNSNSSTEEDLLTVLNDFKTRTKINEAVLRESKAGLAVGKLRSHASKAVSDLAKEVVKKWKTEVEREKHAAGGGSGSKKPLVAKKATSSSTAATPSTPVTPTVSNGTSGKAIDTRSAKGDGLKIESTGDKTRDKCIELIYDALVFDSGAPNDLILQRAKEIEKTTHSDKGGTTGEYRTKMRSLYMNLKDKNNPGLRERIIDGGIPASKIPFMSSAELASDERQQADEKIKADNLFKSLGAGEQEAETNAFQCGRCKQWKTRYRQAQTRSADEPMTTFVTCVNCGNRWKFS